MTPSGNCRTAYNCNLSRQMFDVTVGAWGCVTQLHYRHSLGYCPMQRKFRPFVSFLFATTSVHNCTRTLRTHYYRGRGGLVVRSRPRDRRAPGSKPDSTEDPPYMGPTTRQIILSVQTPFRWCGAEVWRCQLRCRPRHLTAVQNDEVRPKIALVLLQNGTS
ncbi:hypothetical protein AVEN_205215-1 [Araneus ventricosus]|uniref:Uncharacterized protein n=1 Tax=Araneus ventricosus TaxID=182803 RepID=A0A4Y2JR56_ARAVE|nr:hypothetical protein AVEN_205215-1 [Araneus ventricosus]